VSLDPACISRIRLKPEWVRERLHLLYNLGGPELGAVHQAEIHALEQILHRGRTAVYDGIPVELLY